MVKTKKDIVDKDGNKIVKLSPKLKEQRKAAFEAIVKKAILINMTRKQMANLPFDTIMTDKICKDFNITDKSYVHVRKNILNPQYLTNIRSLINDALLMVWNNTRPWDNVGFRILPMDQYDDLNKTFGKIKDEFEEAVQVFKDNYVTYVTEAKKALGKAFNQSDYPNKSDLDALFALDIQTSTFPDIDDIRLNLSNEELCEMQNDIVEKYTETIKNAIKDLCSMIENGDKNQAITLLSTVKKMNVDNDPTINMNLVNIEKDIKNKFGLKSTTKKDKDLKEDEMMMIDDLEDFDEGELTDLGFGG